MHRRLRILHLIGSGARGGREKQLFSILKAQADVPNYDVGVLYQDPSGPSYTHISSLPNVRVEHLPDCGEFSIQSMRSCVRAIRASDLIFLHSPRLAFMVPLLLTRKPLIYRLSGIFTMPIRILGRFSSKAKTMKSNGTYEERDKDATGSFEWITTRPRRNHGGAGQALVAKSQQLLRWLFFQRTLAKRASVVLVNSRFLLDRAQELYRVPSEKFRHIYSGIDPAFEKSRLDQARAPPNSDCTRFTIGVVARLDARKRIDRLFTAIAPLVTKNRPLRVLIAGEGDQKRQLMFLARSLGIEGIVEFLGEVDNPYDVLMLSHLFVLPSENEAFSNSVLEAMFAGVPVAVFAGGCGNTEMIRSGIDGFVVTDVAELTGLIERMMTDKELARRIGAEARRSLCEKGLTVDRYMDSLDGVVTEVARMSK